jgi:diaminopimelate epimerase
VRFSKYHGLGNDFLIVDLRAAPDTAAAAWQDEAVVRALCDRAFGVGGDGVLPILPPVTPGSAARMRVLNADGSEAEMCGNGLRCVVKHLADHDPDLGREALVIDTGAGPLRCELQRGPDDAGPVRSVTVDMGRPRLTRAEIPMTGPAGERCVEQPIELAGDDRSRAVTAVSMGNPHAIVFCDTAPQTRQLAAAIGPALETHAWFPRKTNAELAFVKSPHQIDLVVWERGVGITNACGTGACATVVAACLTGRARPGDEVCVHLPGGDLTITVAPDLSTVWMRGPAAHVFDGDLEISAILAAARPAR